MPINLRQKLKKIRKTDYLLLLLLIPLIVFAVFYFRREKTYVYVDLTFNRKYSQGFPVPPEYWQVNNIQVGDNAYNSIGDNIASVIDVEKTLSDGGLRTNIELQLKLRAVYDTRTKEYVLDGKPLVIGNSLTIYLGSSQFDGIVKNVYLKPEDRYKGYRQAKATLKVMYREIESWQAESLKNFEVRNSKNQTIVKVLSVEIQPAEILTQTSQGQALKAQHPFKKDATIILELPQVLCSGSGCLYDTYKPFDVGSTFWADNGKAFIGGASIMDVQISDAKW